MSASHPHWPVYGMVLMNGLYVQDDYGNLLFATGEIIEQWGYFIAGCFAA